MTTNSTLTDSVSITEPRAEWSTAGRFLAAFARRDYDALASCLDPDVTLRALVPRGVITMTGATAVRDRIAGWFGGADDFELVDAAIGQVGPRTYLRWRVRMWNPITGPRVAEQHVFTRGTDRFDALDLVCSGFHAETAVAS